ncbi:MAG: type VI secretion protein IcmF/TssM N-terminal domain-containing protein [Janthinobacterium lividum]
MIDNLLNALQPYLTEIYFFALLIGIVLIIFIIWFISRSIARRLRQKTWTRAPQKSDEEGQTFREKMAYLRDKFSFRRQSLQREFGWVDKDDVSSSFKHTVEILKTYLGTRTSQYDLPWYLMIGVEGSGKTTLLNDLDLELPIGRPSDETSPEHTKLNWYFFDQGVVMDVKGKYFLDKDHLASDEKTYGYILNLLTRVRPRRPLDGIILTLPADELLDNLNYSESDITARAQHLHTQLWKLQNTLGMKIPIYILVTKSDAIPGFKQFVGALNPQNYQDMVGWSCPYTLDTSYTSSWSQELFNHVSDYLNKIRATLLTSGNQENLNQQEGRFLFPIEFARLRNSLTTYLDTIFKDSTYHESFFLRGVYFCGKAASQPWKMQPLALSVHNPLIAEHIPGNAEKIVFLRDLFEKKIFKEFTLGKPIHRILNSTNRLLNGMKIAAISVAALWLFGLMSAHQRLTQDIRTLLPALQQVDASLTGLKKFTQGEEDPKYQNYLTDQSKKILNVFSNIQAVNLNSFFMPASWFSTIDQEILSSLAVGYDHIIFPSFYVVLSKKAGEIVTIGSYGHRQINAEQRILNPLFFTSFNQLQDYIRQINVLERLSDNYNNLKNTKNMNDLGELINYLYNKNLPGQFYQSSDYYRNALPKTSGRLFDLSIYKNSAIEKLGVLYRNFTEDAFNLQQTFPIFASLADKLNQLNDSRALQDIDDVKLRAISEEAIAVADALSSGQLNWVERDFFDPGPLFSSLVNDVIQSSLLGNDVANELSQRADGEFIKFKLELQTYQSLLTGSFFDVRQGQVVASPSKGLVQFIDAMSTFLDEPFMWKSDEHTLYLKVPLHKILFWDENILRRAVKIVDSYNDFSSKKVKSQPANLHNIMRTVGRNSVRKKVLNHIAQAETFQEEPPEDGFGQRELIHGQVENIALVTPYLSKLLGAFHDGVSVIQNAKLREMLVVENYGLLTKIEQMLENDNLYEPNDDAIISWNGDLGLGMRAFGVHDLNDMKVYLKAQRFRLHFLAKELAEPILTLLSLGYLEDVPLNLPLAERWTRIIATMDDYDKKTPGNTLTALEQFIAYDMNEVTLESSENLRDKINDFGEGDYFIQIRDDLIKNILRRSQQSEQRHFYERYHQAAQFFNLNLAGRFPFTHRDDKRGNIEADPVDVANFLELYNNIPQKQLKALAQKMSASDGDGSVKKFIQSIESIKPLMLATLDLGNQDLVPRIDVDVEFRTDRCQEKGGEKIIDWGLQIGGQNTDFLDQKVTNTWEVGKPIVVSLRWAQDAANLPIADPRKPFLSVTDSTANFTYTGRWSLIRLIKEHSVQWYDQSSSGAQAQILEFKIPTAFNVQAYQGHEPLPYERRSEEAKVYLRILLKEPAKVIKNLKEDDTNVNAKNDKADQAKQAKEMPKSDRVEKPKVLSIPHFPVMAPVIHAKPSFMKK